MLLTSWHKMNQKEKEKTWLFDQFSINYANN